MAQRPSVKLSRRRGDGGQERLGRRPARRSSSSPAMAEGRTAADTGEAYRQRGPFAGGAGNGDRSAMFFDDLFDGRETQAGSGALRRKERLEDLIENFSRNRGAVVLDQDLHFNTAAGAMLGDLNM